jgi:hypothetical protein
MLLLIPEISVGQFSDQEIIRIYGRRWDTSYPHISSPSSTLSIDKGGEQWLVNGKKIKG